MGRVLRVLALALGLLAWQGPAFAQQIVNGGGGSGGGTPGGSSGQIQYNNAGAFGGFTLAGDCTFSQPNITCTKTSGTTFGTGATSTLTAGVGLSAAAGTCNSGAISGTVTLAACNAVLTKTGNYTVANGDGFDTINCNNSGGCVFTIPQATASGNFAAGWGVCFTSQLGTVTLSPTTSTIYGAGTSFVAGQTECLQSDGTNYLGTGGASPSTVTGVFTTLSGKVEGVRVITAAGAVTAATSDQHICVNKASGAATTVNLFATPTVGTTLTVDDCKGDAATNNITVTPAAGNIDGSATFVINTNWGSWTGYYNGTVWKTTSAR